MTARSPIAIGGGEFMHDETAVAYVKTAADFWSRLLARRRTRIALAFLAAVIAVSALAPLIVSVFGLPQPNTQHLHALDRFGNPRGPSSAHLLGVDPLGRDVLSRLIYGGRVTLAAALGATAIALVIGVTVGAIAGYAGGVIDAVLSRATEVVLCVPVLLLALGLAAACSTDRGCLGGALHPGFVLVTLVMSATGWPYLARLVRAQTVTVRDREFVTAARCAGASHVGILWRDIVPNLVGPVSVFAAFALPGFMLLEAGLAFLGVGVPQPTASWGSMLADSVDTFNTAWWYFAAPAIAIAVTAIAFNVVADALREAMDPRR